MKRYPGAVKARKKEAKHEFIISDEDKPLYLIGNAQHQGARNYQEDSFAFSDISQNAMSQKGLLAVLCDGMGGLENGAQTSGYVVSALQKGAAALLPTDDFRGDFLPLISQVNDDVHERFNPNGIRTGTTLVMAYLYKGRLYWACAGDSRLYLVRGGYIYAVNEDHDYRNELLGGYLDGDNTLDAAKTDRQKDSLTSYIGGDLKYLDISRDGYPLRSGDVLILCSDGIYNGISECELLRCALSENPQHACEEAASEVVGRGIPTQDNLTIMMIRVN